MLEARGLTKTYGSNTALDQLNLTIGPGEVYCLLGANGAGKTTTINLFLSFITPDSGSALVNGIESAAKPDEARKLITYIPENLSLYPTLTGFENLQYFSGLAGVKASADELTQALVQAGLTADEALRPVGGYSKGMRQKVGIAMAIARDTRALLLDEPTSGLDPSASNEFAELLSAMSARGAAILMATHDLFRAKETGTRIGIMKKGRLADEMSSAEISHSDLESVYLKHIRG
ncbi:ABC-2 type transport system ATP-binding protein [Cyclonatronum proteinivorum]|uniref:ABC-2 type transport system ATP-binding protein n=1 Tax=Cyclonatronum proteinivorum TaxID=1457365 RepID=A0A345UG41_9BACT|nr:ABC transporter ATP-binding protein [Cyclonatronum proteinivorum]AXI99442.1 ABC-2 type transport system ATP-binding protein [Cyclonatronum proteinivorum]